MVDAVELLQTAGLGLVLLSILVFGVAPGLVLRTLVLIYPKDDPRRRDLVADLYDVPFLERPLFVGQQVETVLFEGVPQRLRSVTRARRIAGRPDADPPAPPPAPNATGPADPPLQCALPGCTATVEQPDDGRPPRLYCSPAHRAAARNMRHTARMSSVAMGQVSIPSPS